MLVSYVGFDGQGHRGELVVDHAVAGRKIGKVRRRDAVSEHVQDPGALGQISSLRLLVLRYLQVVGPLVVLAGLVAVDYLTIFEEPTPLELI